MKYISLILILSLLFSCRSDCKKVEKGTAHAIVVKLYKNGQENEFEALGYTKFKVVEYDSTMAIHKIKGGLYQQEKYFFPLAHKFAQTTFVFSGDTVSPDTLIVGDYNTRMVYTTKCNYALEIDEPKVKHSTFSSVAVRDFDAETQNLILELNK